MSLHRAALAAALLGTVFVGTAAAQQDLFSPVNNRQAFIAPGQLLRHVAADPANARIELVAARAHLVSEKQASLRMSLPGGIDIEAKQTGFEVMQSGNSVWYGSTRGSRALNFGTQRGNPIDHLADSVILVRSGDTVLGTIRVGGELYRLVPVDDGQHALVEVDQSAFLPDEDEAAYEEMKRAPSENVGKSFAPLAQAKAISTIRVMVAFGPAARAAVANPQQAIDLSFSESNTALAATNTDIRFQQAGAIQNFTQSESTNYSTMLSRLTNLSDGYYDAIGGQRNTNTADIVAYVAPVSTGLCGQAAGIATSNANAYFVMNPNCLSGNYTFVHEAGHVVGARHDNDSNTTPYAYGHGYVITSQNRRTVMAVNNGPCSTCTRLGAFSSPNYTFNGVPIGTASYNDNTRVWRTRGPTVAAFR
jgi:peptidyl-Asp metalloendopeptidase